MIKLSAVNLGWECKGGEKFKKGFLLYALKRLQPGRQLGRALKPSCTEIVNKRSRIGEAKKWKKRKGEETRRYTEEGARRGEEKGWENKPA